MESINSHAGWIRRFWDLMRNLYGKDVWDKRYPEESKKLWTAVVETMSFEKLDQGLLTLTRTTKHKYVDFPPTPIAFKALCDGIYTHHDRAAKPPLWLGIDKAKDAPKRLKFDSNGYSASEEVAVINMIKIYQHLKNPEKVKELQGRLAMIRSLNPGKELTEDELNRMTLEKEIESIKQLITEFTNVGNTLYAREYGKLLKKKEGELNNIAQVKRIGIERYYQEDDKPIA